MKFNDNSKKLLCSGPCPYEPLTYPSGTLKDGTTYVFTATANNAGAVFNDLGSGAIEFGSTSDETLTVTFSAPVDMQFTNSAVAGTRIVWHGNGTRGTVANTDGSSWCYTAGTVDANINVVGQQADGLNETGVTMSADWGVLETFGATVVDLTSYVYDAYNFEARPLGDKVEQPICDVVETLCKKVAVGPPPAAAPVLPTELDICEGQFVECAGPTGWVGDAGAVFTENSGTVDMTDWTTFATETSPDHVTDMLFNVDFGMIYYYLRTMRMYAWLDFRYQFNGVTQQTFTSLKYHYNDRRIDTILGLHMRSWAGSVFHRENLPANTVITFQTKVRQNFNSATGTNPYGRIIRQGLRSTEGVLFMPRNIVVGSL